MTHGEELSSDMNQDPVVLTYLESVLMHRAAAASAGASPSKSGPEAPARPGVAVSIPRHPPTPSPPRAASTGSALNVKKARLLQGETWDGAKRRRMAGGQEGKREEPSPQPPHSTLLASLLQSFSSSLQEQQRGLSPGSRASSPEQDDDEPRGGGRLGGRRAEEARRGSPSVAAAAPRLSCSARLKAVASMVGKGSGTPSSPKPSAACSQLALLLSSDCQLQQYSRARSLEPSASQRLAAIASKKQAGGAPERPTAKSPSAPRDKASRSPASPGAGSSLLMHLLNSPKPQEANGHGWVAGGEPGCRARSRQPVFNREEGRGEPRPCAPMDLSFKPRSCDPVTLQSSSLEQMTESLLFSWNPKGPGMKGPEIKQDEEDCPETKSHHKVTLLQLLLGHHSGPKGSITPELSADTPPPVPLCRRSSLLEPFPPPSSRPEKSPSQQSRSTPSSRLSPADSAARTFSAPGDPSRKTPLQSPAAAEPAKAHRFLEQPLACESPRAAPFPKPLFALELRQGSPAAPLTGDDRLSNFSFSASKLLHDLAHTGSHKSPEPSPVDSELRGGLEPKLAKDCAGPPLGFQVSDPGAGQERATLQPVSGRAAPDLDHLLERRSVLQLLLRSTEKERVTQDHSRGRRGEQVAQEERRGGAEAISVVKVKTEPIEEETRADQSARCQPAALGEAPENCLPLDIVKQEVGSPRPPPLPAPSHAVSRGGVLSQLLLRDSSGPMDNYPPRGQPGPEAPSAHSNPCPVARVRHLHPGSPTELWDLQKKPVALNGHAFSSNGLSEPGVGARGRCKALEGQCGHGGAEAEPRGDLKGAQGFNVLKQLLLSENGIKVLSQHRTLQNGVSPGHSAKLPGPDPFHRERELRRNGKESPVDVELARSPGNIRLPQAQRGTLPEPPWLTKANPILYYMLQRGGGEAQPLGLSAPRAGEGEATARKERKRPPQRWEAERRDGPGWVKEEPMEPLPCFGSHPAQPPPSPGQILEKVGAIKREPD
ncbi:nuclear receptor-interacting protein 1 [Narcine bancroftii]|uniref:nuclear receptor-interacting protein 1 n=1 Tax=Narcine bancroftii TaxID=1343680 RepID=UPI003831B689